MQINGEVRRSARAERSAGRVAAEGGNVLFVHSQQIALNELAAPAVVLELARKGGKVDARGMVAQRSNSLMVDKTFLSFWSALLLI